MKIQIKRGLAANVGSLVLARGELAHVTDTNDLYVGIDNTTAKHKLTENDVYTPVEYTKYLARKQYTAEDTISDHGTGDYIPINDFGEIPIAYYPTSMMNEVVFVSILPTKNIDEDRLYVLTSGAEANATWVYRSGNWIRLKEWANFTFDGGTF